MTTVFSTLIHSGGNNRQPSQSAPRSFNSNHQIYHDLFTNDSMTGNENDFDLSDVIKNAIGQLKNSPHSRLNRRRSTSAKMPKYKHPCGICQKSVNKNQKLYAARYALFGSIGNAMVLLLKSMTCLLLKMTVISGNAFCAALKI